VKRTTLKRKTPLKRGGKLRRVSAKRKGQNEVYKDVREKFLTNNPICQVCRCKMASQVHHRRGGSGIGSMRWSFSWRFALSAITKSTTSQLGHTQKIIWSRDEPVS
jgi:hypothetical protein